MHTGESMLDRCIDSVCNLSEMSVAKAASLALMLQDRADPSLLFLRARLAMILQMLRTETHTYALTSCSL